LALRGKIESNAYNIVVLIVRYIN